MGGVGKLLNSIRTALARLSQEKDGKEYDRREPSEGTYPYTIQTDSEGEDS